jgi:hypothetical protein
MSHTDRLYEASVVEQWGGKAGYEPTATICHVYKSHVPGGIPLYEWYRRGTRTYATNPTALGWGWQRSRAVGFVLSRPVRGASPLYRSDSGGCALLLDRKSGLGDGKIALIGYVFEKWVEGTVPLREWQWTGFGMGFYFSQEFTTPEIAAFRERHRLLFCKLGRHNRLPESLQGLVRDAYSGSHSVWHHPVTDDAVVVTVVCGVHYYGPVHLPACSMRIGVNRTQFFAVPIEQQERILAHAVLHMVGLDHASGLPCSTGSRNGCHISDFDQDMEPFVLTDTALRDSQGSLCLPLRLSCVRSGTVYSVIKDNGRRGVSSTQLGLRLADA